MWGLAFDAKGGGGDGDRREGLERRGVEGRGGDERARSEGGKGALIVEEAACGKRDHAASQMLMRDYTRMKRVRNLQ